MPQVLPPLVTPRVSTTVYCPTPTAVINNGDGVYTTDADGVITAGGSSRAQFRPSKALGHHSQSRNGLTCETVGATAEAPYWNTHAGWRTLTEPPVAKSVEGDDETECDMFLKSPLESTQRGVVVPRWRHERQGGLTSPTVAAAKNDAALRMARRRGAPAAGTPHPVRPQDRNAPSSSGDARGACRPSSGLVPTAPAEAPDMNQMAVRSLFRQRQNSLEGGSTVRTGGEADSPAVVASPHTTDAPRQVLTASPHSRVSAVSRASSRGNIDGSHCHLHRQDTAGYVPLSATTPSKNTAYDLRATALHPVPAPESATKTPLDFPHDVSIEQWHRLYAQRAALESQCRWLLYQEQYDRALIARLEQEQCPVAFYAPLPPGPRGTAVRRHHAQPALTTDAELHERLDSALTRLTQPSARPAVSIAGHSTTEKPPTAVRAAGRGSGGTSDNARATEVPCPPTLTGAGLNSMINPENVPVTLATILERVTAQKAQIFEEGLQLLAVLRRTRTLVDEEAAARTELVRAHYRLPHSAVEGPCGMNADGTALRALDAVPLSEQFALVVMEGVPLLHAQCLDERAHELRQLHESATLQLIAQHVFDRFVSDEARQWAKLLAYHHFCLRLAAAYHERDSAVVSVVSPWHGSTRREDPIQRLRQQRLRYVGPTDSPFCSYLRYLEVSITDRTEGESRQRAVTEESEGRESLRVLAEQSRERVLLLNACQDGASAIVRDEATARESVMTKMATQAQRIAAREEHARLLIDARRAAEARILAFCEDVYEQKRQLESSYLTAHLKSFRALRSECLLLAIQKTHEDKDPAEIVLSWSIERSLFILAQQEHRLRQAVLQQEASERAKAAERSDFFALTFWPSACALRQREADAWQCLVSVLFEEYTCRKRLADTARHERAVLFAPRLVQPKGQLSLIALVPALTPQDLAVPVGALEGPALAFSASHLSQVADQRFTHSGSSLPVPSPHLTQRSLTDAQVVLTSHAASSDLRIPTFHSSFGASTSPSPAMPMYWDSALNAPLDACATSATLATELSTTAESEVRDLQKRLLRSFGRPTEDVCELALDSTDVSLPCVAQATPSAVNQSTEMSSVQHAQSLLMLHEAHTSSPPTGARREVRWGKTETVVCDGTNDGTELSPSDEAIGSENISVANAFLGEARGRDHDEDGSEDDCPFPSFLFTFGEDRDLDLRRNVITNLSQFCDFDDLVALFSEAV